MRRPRSDYYLRSNPHDYDDDDFEDDDDPAPVAIPYDEPVYSQPPVRPRIVDDESDVAYDRYQGSESDYRARKRYRQELIDRTNKRMKSANPPRGTSLTPEQYKRLKHIFQEASDAYLIEDIADKDAEFKKAREKAWKLFSKEWDDHMDPDERAMLLNDAIEAHISKVRSELPYALDADYESQIRANLARTPKETAFADMWDTWGKEEFFPDMAAHETKDFNSLPYLTHRHKLHTSRAAEWIVDVNRGIIEGFVEYSDKLDAYVISFKGTIFTRGSDLWADLSSQIGWRNIKSIDIPSTEEGEPPTTTGLPATVGFNKGFWRRFIALWPSVYQALRAVVARQYARSGQHNPEIERGELPTNLNHPVIITGHSLGGALAEICGSVLAQLFPNWDIQLQPFSPARGLSSNEAFDLNPALQRLYDKADRYYGRRDPVPGLPVGHRYHVGYRQHLLNAPSGYTDTTVTPIDPSHIGNHYRGNLWQMIQSLNPKLYAPENTPRVVTTYGEGKPGSKQKSPADKEEMKRRMAYARSFRKKKMN